MGQRSLINLWQTAWRLDSARVASVSESEVHTGRGQRGFTLVELLVVIAIIGALLGLLLPAVQQSREAARMASCRNNLKNLALATQQFHETHGYFPPGCYEFNELYHSWRISILPYLEQNPVFQRIDLNKPWFDETGNLMACLEPIETFRCPTSLIQFPGDSDYEGVSGTAATLGGGWDTLSRGILIRVNTRERAGVRASEVTDGLSNTILIAESLDRRVEEHGCWADGLGVFISNGFVREPGEIFSHHPGGAMVARADGSVMLLRESTAREIVGALCTRDGGETIVTGE
jgi:prepilin-type N-terminal cleavage/methylation domain-containing protein